MMMSSANTVGRSTTPGGPGHPPDSDSGSPAVDDEKALHTLSMITTAPST
jgi:hypothetical protein